MVKKYNIIYIMNDEFFFFFKDILLILQYL